MLILALLNAGDRTPIQWWTFREAVTVSLGRSFSNQVIIRDALVSRYHCDLRPVNLHEMPVRWQVVSHGKNGTFLDGAMVQDVMEVSHGALLQLAPRGPVLKIYLRNVSLSGTDAGDLLHPSEDLLRSDPSGNDSLLPATSASQPQVLNSDILRTRPQAVAEESGGRNAEGAVAASATPSAQSVAGLEANAKPCDHPGTTPEQLFCHHCGQPTRVLYQLQHQQYQVLRVLGEGGMGTTFLAWSPQVSLERSLGGSRGVQSSGLSASRGASSGGRRLVVIKQMNPDMRLIPKAQELFEREARVLQLLNHPGIPRFLDHFVEADQSYLVMELIQGQNLEDYIHHHGPVNLAIALNWLIQICDILLYLHTQDPPVLHRDIKPANIVLRPQDQKVTLVDFGAVKQMLSSMGTCIKVDGYTAPEQEDGNPQVESDLYSLGATLLYLLTGLHPLDCLDLSQTHDFLILDRLPTLPPSLLELLQTALAWNPYDRYANALEFRQALEYVLESCELDSEC